MTAWNYLTFLHVCLGIIGVAGAVPPPVPPPSKQVLDFIDGFNGRLTNRDYITEKDQQLVELRFEPVVITALNGKSALLIEIQVEDYLAFRHIAIPEDHPSVNNVIIIFLYNISGFDNCKFGEIKAEDLKYISLSDLFGNPNCTARFVSFGENTYSTVWPDCRSLVEGRHPFYTYTITCTIFTSTVPILSREHATSFPYIFKKLFRYPLTNAPVGYLSPCENKKPVPCLKP